MNELHRIARALEAGETTSVQVVRQYLSAIDKQNARLNAFIEVFEAEALACARASDERRAAGQPLSALDGVPIAVKDNLCMKGHICAAASNLGDKA